MKDNPTLTEIADEIDIYLKKLQKDPVFNVLDEKYGTRRLWGAWAARRGNRVSIMYVAYQGASTLDRAEALKYLAWLDAGNKGEHWMALREGR